LTFGRYDVAAVGLCYAIYLVAMAWVGLGLRLGVIYYVGLGIALVLALSHMWIIRNRDPAACFRAFLGNHWLGMAVFAGIALDYAVRAGRWPHAL
jgi:4-hydroxybenzoate polyprenyltransferase